MWTGLNDHISNYCLSVLQIFTSIFVIEMLCKLIALTPRGYAKNKWNLFDGFLVLASLADLIMSELVFKNDSSNDSSVLSVMRVFRLVSANFKFI